MPEIGLSLFIERQYNDGGNKDGQKRGAEQSVGSSSQGDSTSGKGGHSKDKAKDGVINDITHEQILAYLEKIEAKLRPKDELDLISKKGEQQEKLFPYRERYLEYVVNNNSEQSDKYQTDLAELYIENLFRLQDKDYTGDILLPHLINPGRKKLISFLEEKTSYNADKLLERVNNSWMFEEKIILLIKKKKYDEAVEIFVENQQFEEAEEFCNQRP